MNKLVFVFFGSFIGSSVSNIIINYLNGYKERKSSKEVIKLSKSILKKYCEFYDEENYE